MYNDLNLLILQVDCETVALRDAQEKYEIAMAERSRNAIHTIPMQCKLTALRVEIVSRMKLIEDLHQRIKNLKEVNENEK